MKKLILTSMLLVGNSSFAGEITPSTEARAVTVDEIETALVGNNQLKTEVKVLATFNNSCQVPLAEELFLIPQTRENNTLELALGFMSHRNCLQEYNPVTITLNLGSFFNFNRADGRFGVVIVNARRTTIGF